VRIKRAKMMVVIVFSIVWMYLKMRTSVSKPYPCLYYACIHVD